MIESGEDDVLIIEDDISTESSPGEIQSPDSEDDELIFDDTESLQKSEVAEQKKSPPAAQIPTGTTSLNAKLNELWLEYGHFTDDSSTSDNSGYGRAEASVNWTPSTQWQFQLSGRAYGYGEDGNHGYSDFEADLGETFIRFTEDRYRITAGMLEVIWGRIDEFPPSDRLSTQDLTRFVLDDLEDRRRTSPTLRFEYFNGNSKLDIIANPYFRKPALPDKDSVWFPVNRETGEVIGLESTSQTRAIVKNASIQQDGPNSSGGVGLRYSTTTSGVDYSLNVQSGRQSLPYFAYDPETNSLKVKYPRSLSMGGDVALEAFGGTLRLEAEWSGDTPVTRRTGTYTTTGSVDWGVALEIFPGDGDGRLNMQLTGRKLLDAPSSLDRDNIVAFNGSYETPFSNNNWRFKTRYYLGLDQKDIYLNPELAYTGISSQEVYLDFHYFDGSNGTPGGFHKDHSTINLGWRLKI